jgi:nitric oxide synthase-interacting protein
LTIAVGKNLPSFWIPSLTPEAKPDEATKPDTKTRCPMSGNPLRIKDLIPVKFTAVADDQKSLITREVRYKCAVTHDALGNSVPCAVLRNTGNVVTMDCVEKLIKKDMRCPFTGEKLKEKDIIPIQRGGTGFAGSGIELSAKKDGPAMQV